MCRHRDRAAVAHGVAGDAGPALRRRRLLALEGVRQDAAGVRARVTDRRVPRRDVTDHRVARLALSDVERGVRRARYEVLLEAPMTALDGVDAVEADVPDGQVAPAEAVDPFPLEAISRVVPGRHVLDRDAVRLDLDTGQEDVLAVEDHLVAICAPDDEIVLLPWDGHATAVGP